MFINYAHRGASAYLPENTLSAFYMGLLQGANGIETDVRKTKDNIPVLFHDAELARVTNGSGAIEDYTYSQLLELSVKCSFQQSEFRDIIPTLEDFLKYFSHQQINFAIELKGAAVEKETLMLIEKYLIEKRVVLTSFEIEFLKIARRHNQNIRLGYLVREINQETFCELEEISAYEICPKASIITKKLVSGLKNRGYNVRAWGVDNVETMKAVFHAGVDGMTVNFPDKLSALRLGTL